MSIKIKSLSSVVIVFMLLSSLIIVSAQTSINLGVGGTLSNAEPVITNSYNSFGNEKDICIAIDPSISEPLISGILTSAPGETIAIHDVTDILKARSNTGSVLPSIN